MVILHKEIEENIYRNTFKWLRLVLLNNMHTPKKWISQTEFTLTLEKLPMLHSEKTTIEFMLL